MNNGMFYIKGIVAGLAAGIPVFLFTKAHAGSLEAFSLLLLITVVSSYAAMNFTGATPFTSPSGVEKEMRQAIPIQVVVLVAAVIGWMAAPFIS